MSAMHYLDGPGVACQTVALTPASRKWALSVTQDRSAVTCRRCLYKLSPAYSRSYYYA